MQLKLHIKGKLIDAILLDASRCKEDGYVDGLKKILQVKHQNELVSSQTIGTFFIEVPGNHTNGAATAIR